jgi:hypothetical protein
MTMYCNWGINDKSSNATITLTHLNQEDLYSKRIMAIKMACPRP